MDLWQGDCLGPPGRHSAPKAEPRAVVVNLLYRPGGKLVRTGELRLIALHGQRDLDFTDLPAQSQRRLFLRMSMSGCGVLVSEFAMLVSRGCMLLGVFVLTDIVMMRRLVVMMRGGVMVSGRLVVMLTRRMLRRLCHCGGVPSGK